MSVVLAADNKLPPMYVLFLEFKTRRMIPLSKSMEGNSWFVLKSNKDTPSPSTDIKVPLLFLKYHSTVTYHEPDESN
jgi:hypothetical protein